MENQVKEKVEEKMYKYEDEIGRWDQKTWRREVKEKEGEEGEKKKDENWQ